MELKIFGSTGLTVSCIGLGMAALGRPGYINLGHERDLEHNYDVAAMEARAHRLLDAAYETGIRYFDAARSYGRAEEFLGSWLRVRNFDKHAVTAGSKWGYTYTAGWQVDADVHEVKEHSLAVLKRQREESLENLGRYLDLYQIHSATLESGVLENSAVLRELAGIREKGVTIGLSVSGAGQKDVIRRAMEIEIDGIRLFDGVQATWNLLEPSAGTALAEAKAAGLGVIIKEALANGRLTDRNTAPDFKENLALLHQATDRLHTTSDALALAAAMAQPWADVVLSGAATIDHLESNVKSVDVTWDAHTASELACLAESTDKYWQLRAHLPWQ